MSLPPCFNFTKVGIFLEKKRWTKSLLSATNKRLVADEQPVAKVVGSVKAQFNTGPQFINHYIAQSLLFTLIMTSYEGIII